MANFVRVAAVTDIPAGQGKAVDVAGTQIAIFNCGGAYYAIDNVCKHKGGPLGEGEVSGTTVTCPWHGWTYDVTTGESHDDPECHVACYPVRVDGDDVLVGI